MENRVVALSVLEDLIHWPPAPRDGSAPRNVSNFYATGSYGGRSSANTSGGSTNHNHSTSSTSSRGAGPGDGHSTNGEEDDEDDDEEESCFVAGSVAGDQHLEPRSRRQARYRAVLMLPYLCQKLGARWVSAEVVPYLIRCAQEEDGQLSFAVGIALLGLTRPLPEGRVRGTGPASVEGGGHPSALPSYLTIEEVRPVVELLAASRDECTRGLVAQVVLPHFLCGVSIEREVRPWPEGWEAAYIPQRVWVEAAAMHGCEDAMEGAGAGVHGGVGVDGGDCHTGGGGAACEREAEELYLAAVARHAHWRQQQQHAAPPVANGGSVRRATIPPPAPPQPARFIDPLRLREDVDHLFDEECTNLSLFSCRNPTLARCGLREAGASSALAAATDRRTRAALVRRLYGGGGGGGGRTGVSSRDDMLLLRRAPLALHGAAYAGDVLAGGGGQIPDYFTWNVGARTLVEEVATWMDTLGAPPSSTTGVRGSAPTATATAAAATLPTSTSSLSNPHRAMLTIADYFDEEWAGGGGGNDAPRRRRAALQARWRAVRALIQGLLNSPEPGAVAVAVEAVAVLLHAVGVTLAGVDRDALPLPPIAVPASPLPPVVAKPHTPLRTEAERQAFRYYTTRRHVAHCLAAAMEPTPSTRTTTATMAAPRRESMDPHAALHHALCTAQRSLLELLTDADRGGGVFTTLTVTEGTAEGVTATPSSSSSTQRQIHFGAGPRAARGAALASWDVCFRAHPAAGGHAGAQRPVDAVHTLLARELASEGGSPLPTRACALTPQAAAVSAAQNLSSAFRLHRLVRVAALRALPFALHTAGLLDEPALGTGAVGAEGADHPLPLETVCRLLLEALAPPSRLPALARELAEGAGGASAPAEGPSPTAASPASLDYGVAEAAVTAVHRLIVEVGVAVPTVVARHMDGHRESTAWQRADAVVCRAAARVLGQLLTLLRVTASTVAVYVNWKARWLLAKRLPGLVAAYLLVAQRLAQAGVSVEVAANTHRPACATGGRSTAAAPVTSALPTVVPPFYMRVVGLLNHLWSSGSSGGGGGGKGTGSSSSSGSPLSQRSLAAGEPTAGQLRLLACEDEEAEAEVRAVAVPCAALLFDVAAQAATRIAAAQAHDPSASPAALTKALGPLLEPLPPLLEQVAAVCASALTDHQPRVRCATASALSSLSRTVSALSVLAVGVHRDSPLSSGVSGPAAAAVEAWRSQLRRITDALVSLMSDGSSAVQLTLVSELADLLVSSTPATAAGNAAEAPGEGGAKGGSGEDPAQVRHTALLSCLDSLAKHEVWRFRERYAVLLCHMCTKFLSPRPTPLSRWPPAAEEESAGWAHTQPLFRLARQELLPMLAAVLLDKVKAVRDTALEAAGQLCRTLHAADLAARVRGPPGAGAAHGEGLSGGGAVDGGRGDEPAGVGNRFVNDVLWPLIRDHPRAWETYLSRSALLRIAVGLRADKSSILLPLLDQLAHDAVLNVRLVVAKVIHGILRRSGPGGGGLAPSAGSGSSPSTSASSPAAMSPILRDRRGGRTFGSSVHHRPGAGGVGRLEREEGLEGGETVPALVEFSEAEKNGVVLRLLRQLLEDPSADVRSEAAQALKVCF